MRALLMDLRFAFRTFLKTPGFTAVAVLSVALGIAVNSAVFTLINTFVYGLVNYPEVDRLVYLMEVVKAGGRMEARPPAVANVRDWARNSPVFEDIAIFSPERRENTVMVDGPAETFEAMGASPSLLSVLRARPVLGRNCAPGEKGVLLGNEYWKRRFGGDTAVLGRTIFAGRDPVAIVGVLPPRFRFLEPTVPDLFVCEDMTLPGYQTRQDHYFMAIARLKPGVSLKRAQAQLDTVAAGLAQAYPETNRNVGVAAIRLRDIGTGGGGRLAFVLLGAVGFVLLIACANVANLLLARLSTRGGEMAIRASLGAGRGRLARQMMSEGLMLALAGGVLGWLMTGWVVDALYLAVPQYSARLYATPVDARVIAFTAAATALTALLFGLAPAWHAARLDLNAALQQANRVTAARGARRLRNAMVVCEVALAIVLLSGAGLMLRTMWRLGAVERGFDPRNLLTMQTHLESRNYEVIASEGRDLKRMLPAVDLFYGRLLERVSALPGVESAAFSGTGSDARTFTVLGRPQPAEGSRPAADYSEVSPSYFRTMRIPLRLGRVFDENDRAGAPWTLVVDESFARKYFPGENPVGKSVRLRIENMEEDRPRTIVGVAGSVKSWARAETAQPQVYASCLQQPEIFPGGSGWQHRLRRLVIRTRADVRSQTAPLTSAVKSIVAELDKEIPVTQVKTMEFILRDGEQDMRSFATLLAAFGLLAAILAACGIYGVMSYLVAECTREIGLRMALGAQPGYVLRFVIRQAFLLTAAGVVCGVLAAAALTRLIADFLFGVTPLDPATHVAVVAGLAAVALLASYIPARRAARVDPMAALRCE